MKLIPTRLILAAAVAAATASLAGCGAVAVGGAAAAGSLVATNRRSPETQLADQHIELQAAARMREVLDGRGHVSTVSYFRKVLLSGEVPTEQDRQRAQEAVQSLEQVQGVVNELAVMPDADAAQRSLDAVITGRVKTALMNTRGVPSNSIKVVTQRGTTYLMGRLTRAETDAATETARNVGEVRQVVRVIDIISEAAALEADSLSLERSRAEPASAPAPASDANASTSAAAQETRAQPVVQPVEFHQPQVIQVEQLPPQD